MVRAILFSACLLTATNIMAQGLGAEVGLNLNTLTANINTEHVTSSFRPGFRAGILTEEALSDQLSLRYGLSYSAKGGNIVFSHQFDNNGIAVQRNIRGYMRIDYAEVPFSLIYSFHQRHSGHFFAGGGLYFSIAGGGIVAYDSDEIGQGGSLQSQYSAVYPASIGSTPGDDFRMFDTGLQGQFGFEHRTGLYAKLGVSYGLLNVASYNNILRNRDLNFSLGYMIR